MKILIFGLPGSGKSTLVKSSKLHQVRLDLGHNSFRSDEARAKFYEKLTRFTSGIMTMKCSFIADTYPEYFDIEVVAKSDAIVYFRLPKDLEEAKVLVDRVGKRDGYTSDFYKLYSKQYANWFKEWKEIFKKWQRTVGAERVHRMSIYEDSLRNNKEANEK